MSDGDRSNEPATLGIFGAISALVLCCFIVGILAYSSGQETERRDKTPAAYSEAAKSKAQKDCAGREGDAAFECIYEKVEASQQQARDEQDLTAQQKSANGTMITAALAFLGLIASVIGIGLVYTTFNETRQANVIARASRQDNRAWMTFKTIMPTPRIHPTPDGKGEERVDFNVTWSNSGATPARNVETWATFQVVANLNLELMAADLIPHFERPPRKEIGSTLGPRSTIDFSTFELSADETAKFKLGNLGVLIYTTVIYRDVYEETPERFSEATLFAGITANNPDGSPSNLGMRPVGHQNSST